jgi:hypothetical protein
MCPRRAPRRGSGAAPCVRAMNRGTHEDVSRCTEAGSYLSARVGPSGSSCGARVVPGVVSLARVFASRGAVAGARPGTFALSTRGGATCGRAPPSYLWRREPLGLTVCASGVRAESARHRRPRRERVASSLRFLRSLAARLTLTSTVDPARPQVRLYSASATGGPRPSCSVRRLPVTIVNRRMYSSTTHRRTRFARAALLPRTWPIGCHRRCSLPSVGGSRGRPPPGLLPRARPGRPAAWLRAVCARGRTLSPAVLSIPRARSDPCIVDARTPPPYRPVCAPRWTIRRITRASTTSRRPPTGRPSRRGGE